MAYSPNRKSPSSCSSFSSNPILAGSFVNPVNGIVFAPVVHLCFLQSPSFGSSASLFQLISVQSFTPQPPFLTKLGQHHQPPLFARFPARHSPTDYWRYPPWHFNGPSLILLYTGAPIDYHETQLSLSSS